MVQIERAIIFVDTVCPKAYDPHTLATEGMGGTEATVTRVAEGLGETQTVWVMQHKRATTTMGKAVYKPLKNYILQKDYKAKAFIVLRHPAVAINLKKLHRDTPVFLWLHDVLDQSIAEYAHELGQLQVGIIVVSDWHKSNLVDKLKLATSVTKWPKIARVYNPIDDDLQPDNTVVDKNKLVFFSSPQKGLTYTLRMFGYLNRAVPETRLYIANPGYMQANLTLPEHVTDLGSLPHKEIIDHVRSSLCVFYPNFFYPETFGLVMAEANAVGTPVITHPIGAASEVLASPVQTMDVREVEPFLDRVVKWQTERPVVRGQDAFRLTNVLKSWYTLLGLR